MGARLAALLFSCALAANAQTQPDPRQVLEKARERVAQRKDRLPNYTCVQTVDRTYLSRAKPELPIPSCDLMSGEKTRNAYRLKIDATDRLRLDVKISGGSEIGSWVGANHFEEGSVMKLVKGPFGTGPFGAFLTDIFSLASDRFNFVEEELMDGARVFRYRFQIPAESSNYNVRTGVGWRVTGYGGEVFIDPDSYGLRRLLVRTSELPEETGACEAQTSVEYANTRIGKSDFLLPRRSSLHLLQRNTTESEISTAYASCRQFLGEANLVDEASVAAIDLPREPITIPAGLAVSLILDKPIDSDTAAVGDAVAAKVAGAVRRAKSRDVVIPAQSPIRGRIVTMERRLDSPRYFVMAFQLETVEIHGVDSPIYANPDLAKGFVFLDGGRRHVLERGFKTRWTTIAAPAGAPHVK